jgi:hypothetical protein
MALSYIVFCSIIRTDGKHTLFCFVWIAQEFQPKNILVFHGTHVNRLHLGIIAVIFLAAAWGTFVKGQR